MTLSNEIRTAILAREDMKARTRGETLDFRCPRHEDTTPSAWLRGGTWGCHRCGFTENIVTLAPLVNVELHGNGTAGPTPAAGHGDIAATFDYVDADGHVLFQVVRREPAGEPKRFVQRRPTANGGWEWRGLPEPNRPLYRLPDVLAAVERGQTIYIVEGEKHADRLARDGLVATTNPGGAEKFLPHHAETLAGANVVILPDNDEPGRKHGRQVAALLAGKAAEIKLLELDGLPPKGDVLDWLEAGHTSRELDELAFERGPYAPGPGEGPPQVFATLAELLERPELLLPPERVVPRLGYRGRAVCLAGPDKSGKSSLLAYAVARLSRRAWFLGERVGGHSGRAVWLGIEEAVGNAVRRFDTFSADRDRVEILILAPTDLLAQTEALLTDWPADLVVIDSLAEYARVTLGRAPDSGDDAGWGAVVRPLVALAREYDCAVVILHHVRKSDGVYRGSSEIAAAVDAMLELSLPPKDASDPTLRYVRGRGRWTVEPFTFRMTDDGDFELAGGSELSVETRVLLHVEQNPGTSKTAIRKAITGRTRTVNEAIERLLQQGALTHDHTGYRAPETLELIA